MTRLANIIVLCVSFLITGCAEQGAAPTQPPSVNLEETDEEGLNQEGSNQDESKQEHGSNQNPILIADEQNPDHQENDAAEQESESAPEVADNSIPPVDHTDDENNNSEDTDDNTTPIIDEQNGDIAVYFNRARQAKPADDLERVILEFINAADHTLDIAVYDLDLESVANAMIDAQERGVTVRFVTDNDNTGAENLAALTLLTNADLPWLDDTADGSKGSGLMHNKFIVADQSRVLSGSTNFTLSGVKGDLDSEGNLQGQGNINNIITVESSHLAEIFTQEFNQYWGDGPGGESDSKFGLSKDDHQLQTVFTDNEAIRIDIQFSPQSKRFFEGSTLDSLANLINQAQSRVYIAQFVMSAQVIADALLTASNMGAEIKGLGDRSFFYRYYSEFLDLKGEAKLNNNEEFETDSHTGHSNNPWENPAEVYAAITNDHDKYHHKYFVVDDLVITGSHNASAAGAFTNDENILVVYDPAVSNRYAEEFLSQFCIAQGSC